MFLLLTRTLSENEPPNHRTTEPIAAPLRGHGAAGALYGTGDPPTHRQARPGPAVDGQRSTPGGFTDTTVRPVAGTREPTYSKAGGGFTDPPTAFSHISRSPDLVAGGGRPRDTSTVPELRACREAIGAAPNRVKPARDSH